MRPLSHCWTRAGAFPNSTTLFFVETNLPKPSPVIVISIPIGPESGKMVVSAKAGLEINSRINKIASLSIDDFIPLLVSGIDGEVTETYTSAPFGEGDDVEKL